MLGRARDASAKSGSPEAIRANIETLVRLSSRGVPRCSIARISASSAVFLSIFWFCVIRMSIPRIRASAAEGPSSFEIIFNVSIASLMSPSESCISARNKSNASP